MDLTHTNTKRRNRQSHHMPSERSQKLAATGKAAAEADALSSRRQRQTRDRNTAGKVRKLFRVGAGIDMPFLILVLVLLVCGVIMMFSASYPIAYYEQENSYFYLFRQGGFALVGVLVMFAMSYLNYEYLKKVSLLVLGAGFVALVAVFFFPSSTGVHRWIEFGLFNLQASEIMKFAIILFLAHWGAYQHKKTNTIKYGALPPLIIFVVTAVLLFFEPHYSGIVIIGILTALMVILYGGKIRWFVIIGSVLVGVVLILAVTGKLGYAMERMDGWGKALEYVDDEMWDQTFQTRNSLYAIGSGGLMGLGLGQSRQKYLYLPEPQNDFIFAIVCEELGLIGALVVLTLFGLLIWRGFVIAMRAKDRFGTLLAAGLTAQIGIQVVLNIFVITDWMPNTGISLPFFSYGGSSLIMILFQMGIILSISRTANMSKI
ncbi:FtsW/RodA/SpoVE family cell cycle protein [Ruminococcus sp. zg-921]|uniref:FtsW/RodA/SpoVE family cell cycle protein n=1 Tax=Ruminococcus sp. zg-921 TaxID=2678506 RepID=UPI00210AAC8A|nr:putative peptidoglycan glycosyltransferase FtsW [Ruminococcus sp. zg-921]